jgi:hypothetical protein
MIIIIVLATVITIVNYDHKTLIVQAKSFHYTIENITSRNYPKNEHDH